MRLLGLDYGSKKVGVALTDAEGRMAFPKCVLPNDSALLTHLTELITAEHVEAVVVGESKNYEGKDNIVMAAAKAFAGKLQEITGLSVYFEPETLTTKEAERLQGPSDLTDASAAALILQSYLDRTHHGEQ